MNKLPIYEAGKADPVGYVVIPDDPLEVRRAELKRILAGVQKEWDTVILCASIYKPGVRTSGKDGRPEHIIIRETSADGAAKADRLFRPRVERLERLIKQAK